MKKTGMKKTIIITALTIFTILLISLVSAEYQKVCLNKGEKIKFSKCNPYMKDYTCGEDKCQICVNEISEGIYCPANSCGALGGKCSSFENASIDSSPPVMIINNPLNNQIYDSKSVLINIELDETGDLYYLDNINEPDRWVRICSDCDIYNRNKNLNEGFNNITFKAVDVLGHESYETRTFTIDSKIPRIHKTEPRSEYASGLFQVQYTEANIKTITLFYGNIETGFKTESSTECTSGEKQWCSFNVDLKDYNDERIQYYFEIEDIAGNIKKSQIRQNLRVDTIFPIFNNPTSYYTQGVGRDSRYLYFTFNITEKNLDKITYSYLDSRNRTKEGTICSNLDENGICETKKSFSNGNHSIDIQITDEAGNAIAFPIEFEVDY